MSYKHFYHGYICINEFTYPNPECVDLHSYEYLSVSVCAHMCACVLVASL